MEYDKRNDKLPVPDSEAASCTDCSQLSDLPCQADLPSTVNVYSSENVHVGPKNIYKGNVSITHIVLPDSKPDSEKTFDDVKLEKLPENICNGNFMHNPSGQIFNIPNGKYSSSTSPIIMIEGNQKKTIKLFHWWFLVCTVVLFSTVILFAVIYMINNSSSARHKHPSGTFTGEYSKGKPEEIYYHLMSRTSWVAQPPNSPGDVLKHPVPEVDILHTATEFCFDHNNCSYLGVIEVCLSTISHVVYDIERRLQLTHKPSTNVRSIQDFHIGSFGFADIAYNFLISGNGYVYEGRGWDTIGASVQGRNVHIISIALIGTFTVQEPSDLQIQVLERFLQEGVFYGKIAKDYKLHAHCQWSNTVSPGKTVVRRLEKMSHWNKDCNQCCQSQ